jgi:hypothetical protein
VIYIIRDFIEDHEWFDVVALFLSIALLICFILYWMDDCKISDGVVVDKEYVQESSNIIMINDTFTIDEDPERYVLTLKNGDKTGRVKVSKERYDDTNIGDYVSR